jgi:DNA-binding response OmpR family regulator
MDGTGIGTGTDAGGRVLVVDDEREVADGYALKLRKRYDVETAYGGEEALEVVDDDVDVVLLDRRMPHRSGDEVLAELRERDVSCRVIMLTAIDPDFDVLGMSFDDYLCKPVSDEDLYGAIESQLRIAATERLGEYFRLVATRAVLESQLPDARLDDSAEYAALDERTDRLRSELADRIDGFEEFAAEFEAIDRATRRP